jgi:phosphatidylglycerol:prolipoprotein diacylglycerol transferase
MAPTLLGLRAYPLVVALAVLIAAASSIVAARRAGVPLLRLLALEALLVALGVTGAKLFWMWDTGVHAAPWSIPFNVDGLRWPGGIAAVLLALPLLAPLLGLSTLRVADVLAPPIAGAMALVRIGCFLQGCCFGPVSDLPWAVTFPLRSKAWEMHAASGLIARDHLHSLPVHPLQLYFGAWSLLVAIMLFRRLSRSRREGDVFLLFLILHEAGKAALESLRVPPNPPLQIVSLALAATAAVVWLVRVSRRREVSTAASLET